MSSSRAPTFIVCLLMIGALTHHQQSAFAQDVNSRAASVDEPRISVGDPNANSAGAPTRHAYSQKLSGHRMMHFGKKSSLQMGDNQALDLTTAPASTGDLASNQLLAARQQLGYPYSLFFTPALSEAEFKAATRRQHLIEIVSNLLDISRRKDCDDPSKPKAVSAAGTQAARMAAANRLQAAPPGFQLMRFSLPGDQPERLLNMESKRIRKPASPFGEDFIDLDKHFEDEANTAALMKSQNLVEAKPSSDEQVAGQQSQQDSADINLVGRSVPFHMNAGADMPRLTLEQIQNILSGRKIFDTPRSSGQPAPMSNFGKRPEPAKMTFMHFG